MPRLPLARPRSRALVLVCLILAALGLAAVPGLRSASGQAALAEAYVLPGDAANGPAAGRQEQPQVAAGADARLVVWADYRTVLDEESRPGGVGFDHHSGLGIGSVADIYAARLDSAGRVIDTTPVVVSQAELGQAFPRVAWNGQNWLVAWFTKRPLNEFTHAYDIVAARVSPAGQVLDADPLVVASDVQNGAWPETVIADAAGNWVVVWTDFLPPEAGVVPRGVFVARVSNDGAVLDAEGRVAYNHHSQYLSFPDLARAGDRYMLTFEGYVGSVQAAWAMPLDADFNPLRPGPEQIGPGVRPRVASDGETFFAVMAGTATRVSRDGDPLDPAGIQLSPPASGQAAAQPAWDGTNWLVSYNAYNFSGDDIAAARVSPAGRVLGGVMLDAGAGHQTWSSLAPMPGGGAQVVWHDAASGDINAAPVSAAGAAGPEATVSLGAPRQSEARLASNGNGFLAVFRSQTSGAARIVGQHLDSDGAPVDQEPFVIAEGALTNNPSVAWNGSAYLAVWDQPSQTGARQTFARVVPSSGPPAAPAFFVMNGDAPDAAGLDGNFLVVNILQETSQIRTTKAARVSGAGAVVGAPFTVDRAFNFAPRVASFGGRWLVVWERHNNHDDSPGSILGSFVSPADGSLTASFVAGNTAGDDRAPHLAVSGEQALVAWTHGDVAGRGGDISARRLNADGTSPDATAAGSPLVAAPEAQVATAVAWDGHQYLVTWVDHRGGPFPRLSTGDVYAARVSTSNVRLEEFPVADSALPEGTPSVAAADGLTLFSYAKFYPEAPYASYRLTLRAARFGAPDLGGVPAAPSQLFAEQVNNGPGGGTVRLTWRDNSSDETGFRLERSTDGVSFTHVGQLPAGTVAAENVAAGSSAQNYFRVRAFNAAGESADSNVATPPVANILSPPTTTVYDHPVTIPFVVAASDPDGVARVEFYAALNGGEAALIAADTTADAQGRYQFDWAAPGGTYNLTAKAVDVTGASTLAWQSSILVRRAPTATLDAPADGATFAEPAHVTLTASAHTNNSRSDERVERLDFYAGDVWIGRGANTDAYGPWSFTWQNAPAGEHAVTAHATSNWGQTGVSVPVRVRVGQPPAPDPNAAPAVTLTSPAGGANVAAGAPVSVTAAASDGDGQIARVEFRANGFLVETDTSEPYAAELRLPGGAHSLTAVAVDDKGGTTASAAVGVNVARGAGAQLVSSVGDGRSVFGPSTLTRAGAPMNKELADDFDLAGDVDRVVLYGRRGFNAPDDPAVRGAYVRFYAWENGAPGALQEEMFLPAGDPGLVYDARVVNSVDVRLPRSFRASGKHFVSVQLFVEGLNGYWYWSSARSGAPAGSPVKMRDAYAGNRWETAGDSGGTYNCDAVFALYGTHRAGPAVSAVTPASVARSGYFTVSGANFGAAQNGGRVTVGGHAAHVARWTDSQIIAYAPEAAVLGSAPVQVTTAAGAGGGASVNVTARPSDGRVRWRFTMAADYANHRAGVGPDGTVYVSDVSGRLYALSPSGALKWIFQAGLGGSVGPVTVGADGTVYVGGWTARDPAQPCQFDPVNVHGLFAVNPDGTQKWLFNRACDTFTAGPNVGPDGKVYAVTDVGGIGVFALNPDGSLAWNVDRYGVSVPVGAELVFGPAAPGQSPTQFYFQNSPSTGPQDTLKGYTVDGRKVFEQAVNGQGQPAAGRLTGNVFTTSFPTGAGWRLRSHTPQGALRWQSPITPVSGLSAPDAAPDETVYVTADGSVLHAVDPSNGAVRWSYDDPYLINAPVVSPDNRLVLMGGRVGYGQPGFFAGVGTDGRLLWRQYLPDEPGLNEYGQIAPSNRARFTADGQTAYVAADVLGDNSSGGRPVYSYFYALDTSAADVPVNRPPQVSVTGPVPGTKFTRGAPVTLSADVADDGALAGVDFYVNSRLVSTDAAAPYGFVYAPPAPGDYSVRVVARDAGGLDAEAASSFTVVNETPRVTWTRPADGSTFQPGATVTLKAKATDPDGQIVKVEFNSSRSGTVGFDTTPDEAGDYSVEFIPADGAHTVYAVAADNDGAIGGAEVNINVAAAPTPTPQPTPAPTPDPTAPAVRITSPPSGSTFALGARVTLTAEATASAGRTVARVDFVRGPGTQGYVFCTDFNAPYNCTITDHSTQLYDMVAVAYDSAGVRGQSAPAHVVFEDSRRVSISGKLRHKASQPGNEIFLTGALVKLELDNQPYRETRTDAQGNYRFEDLAWGGGFTLKPSEPGYAFYPPAVSWGGVVEDEVYDFVADGPVPPAPTPTPAPGAGGLAWERFYSGPTGRGASSPLLFVDAAGNSYVAGVTPGPAGGDDLDIVTMKYDPAGARLWAKTFAGPGGAADRAADIKVDGDGNVYVAGHAWGGAATWQDFVTVKYDAAGNQLWARYFDGPRGETDEARALELDAAGNVYVAGYVTAADSSGRFYWEFATVKYDPAGTEQWARLHSTKKYGEGHMGVDLAVDAAGNSYVTGLAWLGTSGGDAAKDIITVKYGPAGAVLWASRFNGGGAAEAQDEVAGVLLDPAGNAYVYGHHRPNAAQADFLLLKLDGASGATVWNRAWAAPGYDYARDAAVDSASGVVLTGETFDPDYYAATGYGTSDVATVKFDGAGNLLWERVYRAFPGKLDAGRRVTLDASGAAYVGAYSEGFFNSDAAVIKYRADGSEAWVYRYDNPSHTTDQPAAVRTDGAGNVYLAGSAFTQTAAGERLDISLVKLGVAPSAALNSPPDVSLSVAPSGETAPARASLAAPASGTASVAGCGVTLTAAAADRDGTVTKVEFYNGTALVGTDTAAPYSVNWTPPAGGTYAVTAMATDNNGATRATATSALTLACGPAPTPTPPAVYALSGQVTSGGAALAGVTVTLSGSQAATATTGADGRYTFADLPAGANCTVTPALAGYEFTPASRSFASVTSNQAADFSAAQARVNYALASNGATAAASSTLDTTRHASAAINGDRRGLHWGSGPVTDGSGWTDATNNAFPDWLEVSFGGGAKTIGEVSVYGLQDNYASPSEPTESLAATKYALASFEVRYWDGAAWKPVPGGTVTANDRVWRKLTFAPLTTSKIRVVVSGAQAGYSRVVEVEAWGAPAGAAPQRANHALASNGAVATATSTLDSTRLPLAAVNGDRRGLHWGSDPSTGSGWTDKTGNAFPDRLEVSFPGARAVDEVSVIGLQDAFQSPAEPAEAMTSSSYALTSFLVEYWTGSAWAAVPGGSVTGNNKVWRKLTFPAVTTARLRLTVNSALAGYSRVVEFEAWGPASGPPPRVNVAASASGATATASSTLDSTRLPLAAINGDRKGLHWGSDPSTGSGWTDKTGNSFPDRLEVAFSGPKTITEVSVFGLQDNYSSPAEPTEAMASASYALQDFDVEYWTGSAWAVVPGGSVTGNNRVWRKVTFPALTTTKVRISVKRALGSYSRVVEVEAY